MALENNSLGIYLSKGPKSLTETSDNKSPLSKERRQKNLRFQPCPRGWRLSEIQSHNSCHSKVRSKGLLSTTKVRKGYQPARKYVGG